MHPLPFIVWQETRIAARDVSLELYHLDASEADFNLALTLESVGALELSGTFPTAGAARLDIAFIDRPAVIELDGERGLLTSSGDAGEVYLHLEGDLARIEGSVGLYWNALEEGVRPSTRGFAVTFALRDVAVQRR